MNNSQFIRCYRNTELATYINRNAKRYAAKRADFRQDLQQEGWAALAGSSSTEEALIKDRARKAIFAAYMRDYRFRQADCLGKAAAFPAAGGDSSEFRHDIAKNV